MITQILAVIQALVNFGMALYVYGLLATRRNLPLKYKILGWSIIVINCYTVQYFVRQATGS